MSATTGGALKAFIESQGLGLPAFQDEAPEDQAMPYVVIQPGLALVPGPLEDGAVSVGVETVQIDLYLPYKSKDTDNPPNKVVESATLPRQLYRALHGSRLLTQGNNLPATTVYSVLVRNTIRMLELDNNLVHHAITADVFQVI